MSPTVILSPPVIELQVLTQEVGSLSKLLQEVQDTDFSEIKAKICEAYAKNCKLFVSERKNAT